MSQYRNHLISRNFQMNGLVSLFDPLIGEGERFFNSNNVWSCVPLSKLHNAPSTYQSLELISETGINHTYTLVQNGAYLTLDNIASNALLLKTQSGTNYAQSNFGSAMTIQMTMSFTYTINYAGILGYHNAGPLAQYFNGVIQFGYYPVVSGNPISMPISVINNAQSNDNICFNFAFSIWYNAPTQEYVTTVYINGEPYGTTYQITNNANGIFTNQSLWIGKSYSSTDRYMSGKIYDVLLYNRALTDNEVKQNYFIDKHNYKLL